MKLYDVIVERHNGVYRATVPTLPNLSAEGATRDEAVAEAKNAIEEFFKSVEVVTIAMDVPGHKLNPRSPRVWLESAGGFSGDEDAMLNHIEEIYAERKRQREAVERELDIVAELNAFESNPRPGSPKAVLRAAADCRINLNSDLYKQYVADLETEKLRQRGDAATAVGSERKELAA